MAFYDIREFIDRLKETGDVVSVEQEVDWNLEMGAIIRRSNETRAPAPFFQKIKDYPSGYRLLVPLFPHSGGLLLPLNLILILLTRRS